MGCKESNQTNKQNQEYYEGVIKFGSRSGSDLSPNCLQIKIKKKQIKIFNTSIEGRVKSFSRIRVIVSISEKNDAIFANYLNKGFLKS